MYAEMTATQGNTGSAEIRRSGGRHSEAQLAEQAKLWLMAAMVVVAVVVSTLREAAVAFAG